MFEKMFGGPRDVAKEFEDKKTEEQPTEPIKEEKREPKTIEEVKKAIGDIQELKHKRWETLEKHRDTIEELRRLGVNETNPDTVPRTETVKDILGPIEEELVQISKEISEKREEFDLQPNRAEVIDLRRHRLGELKHRATEAFYKTESGNKVNYIDSQINQIGQNSDIYRSEIQALEEQKEKFFETDKVAYEYKKTIDRITNLDIDLEDMLRKAKQVGYDKNGLMSA